VQVQRPGTIQLPDEPLFESGVVYAPALDLSMKSAIDEFPIVCVGGSAGGLDAYTRLLTHLPANMGVAIVNHLRIFLTASSDLKPISKPRGWPDVITVFLRSLTQHWGGKLIAVIVSGYDGDGAAALCGIKEVGGITIAQKLDTAGQPDMPGSAIASGCIDFVLSPEDIAQEIVRIAHATSPVQ
jgi:two-component system, chemotaxis family, protein-glutamate methylesterase/glutaminase